MTKSYHTINGRIIGETSGGVRIDYLTDALGSVTATLDQNAQLSNTYRYRPYGGQLAKTGAGPDPTFLWVGVQGYRQTQRQFSDVYVRARHYAPGVGLWTTSDFLGFLLPYAGTYCYTNSNPTTFLDPSGLSPKLFGCQPEEEYRIRQCFQSFANLTPFRMIAVMRCMKRILPPEIADHLHVPWTAFALWHLNKIGGGRLGTVCVFCDPAELPEDCGNPCRGSDAIHLLPGPFFLPFIPNDILDKIKCQWRPSRINDCESALRSLGCTSAVAICDQANLSRPDLCGILAHELFHTTHIVHKGIDSPDDFIWAFGCCMCLTENQYDFEKCRRTCLEGHRIRYPASGRFS